MTDKKDPKFFDVNSLGESFEKDLTIDLKRERKKSLKRKIRELSSGQWDILENWLQTVQANEIVNSINDTERKRRPIPELIEELKQQILDSDQFDTEIKDILIEGIPSTKRVYEWLRKDGWDEAILKKIKNNHIFDNKNRARVMNSVLQIAVEGGKGNVKASELYFKLGGDLNREEAKTISDVFKELQGSLTKVNHD